MTQQEHTDEKLIQLLRTDGDGAIDQLFRRYYKYMCQSVYRVIPDANLVEDLTQEVFYELWKKRKTLVINTSVRAYLRRAVVNKALNYIRDRKIKFEDQEELPEVVQLSDRQPSKLEEAELQKLIEKAIENLPEKCRIVFSLSRYEQLSYKEIAQELNISPKTVENQISKALKLLKSALEPYLSLSILSCILHFFC